ncbi:hypothetical protein [Sphingobacterium ginsenosidimutans]|uniref:hypothetical protein n=1 Tax=Sphingobacterium ginsenosidimutans TaxID=687845 RepID=UPI0031F9FA9D
MPLTRCKGGGLFFSGRVPVGLRRRGKAGYAWVCGGKGTGKRARIALKGGIAYGLDVRHSSAEPGNATKKSQQGQLYAKKQ